MLPRRVAAVTVLALLVAAAPAAAATAAAGPSPAPLFVELGLAAVVIAGLVARGAADRLLAATRRRLAAAPAAPGTPHGRESARDAVDDAVRSARGPAGAPG
jgi:hypothetical protein